MRKLALFACLLTACGARRPYGSPCPPAPANSALTRVNALDAGLFPRGWRVVVIDETGWSRLAHSMSTRTAFTRLDERITVVRSRYALTAQDVTLRHTLAHEAGHVACRCASEDVANAWAQERERSDAWGEIKPGEKRVLRLQ